MLYDLTRLKLRTKFFLITVIWLGGGSVLLLMTIKLGEIFLIPLILLQIVLGGYSMFLKCPECGKPVLHNPISIFGIKFNAWTAWIPENCSKCGTELK